MKIQCLPRTWFEQIKGTVLEEQVLAHNKVVSIQSRSGWDSEPPFSEEGLNAMSRNAKALDTFKTQNLRLLVQGFLV